MHAGEFVFDGGIKMFFVLLCVHDLAGFHRVIKVQKTLTTWLRVSAAVSSHCVSQLTLFYPIMSR